MYINFHTHLKDQNSKADVLEIISWDITENLSPLKTHQKFFSLGLHPWKIDQAIDESWAVAELEKWSHHPKCLMLGESGLDRSKSFAQNIEQQKHWFLIHLQLAKESQKPLIIHSVKAFSDILYFLKNKQATKEAFIFHDYNGGAETTKELLKYNCYFSLGPTFLKRNSAIHKSLAYLPLDRLFFETDDSTIHIQEIYAIYPKLTQLQVIQNFKTLFPQRIEHL